MVGSEVAVCAMQLAVVTSTEAALHLDAPACRLLRSGEGGETLLNEERETYEAAGVMLNICQMIIKQQRVMKAP